MRLSYIGDITYVVIDDHDLQILKGEGACHLKKKYFVMMNMPGVTTEQIKQAMELTTEVILTIFPDQLMLLEGYNCITYNDTLRLSTVKAFDEYVNNNNFKVFNITQDAPSTLQ